MSAALPSLLRAAPLPNGAVLLRVRAVRSKKDKRVHGRVELLDSADQILDAFSVRFGLTAWCMVFLPAMRDFALHRRLRCEVREVPTLTTTGEHDAPHSTTRT